jgi:hypothetical protein
MKAGALVPAFALWLVVLAAACRSSPPEASRKPSISAADAGAPIRASEPPRELEACLDGWLRERKLDPYGHPEGTMYAGGTPLFDERTGERKDRIGYVLERHPDARRACSGDAGR